MMSVAEYLREDGSGPFKDYLVRDLIPDTPGDVELAFVFESPHVTELAEGLPVAGQSGKDALRYLMQNGASGQSLGRFAQQRLDQGDGRIAVLNVSNVPMQVAAFRDSEAPDLAVADWELIERIRTSQSRLPSSMREAEARSTSMALVEGLRNRIKAIAVNPKFVVVAAGVFAQRMVGALQDDLARTALRVPHPSYDQWNRVTNKDLPDLIDIRRMFGELVA